jgi:signal transduction histidine kinase
MFTGFRDLPIRLKLTRISMLASASALLLASLGFIVYELVTFRDTMVQNLSEQSEALGINTVSALLFNDPASATETMTALRVRPHVVSAAIYTVGGKLFARYARSDGATVFQLPEQMMEKEESHQFQGGSLFLFRPIISEGERVGSVYIQSDLREMEDRLKRYASIGAGVLVISLLMAYWISSRLQGRISEPILHLARMARTVSQEKNYSVRATVESLDEVGQLVETFNEMLAQIQVREEALQKAHDHLEQKVEERTRELQQEIGERKQAEASLKNSTALLEAANKELEAFSYSVSHDLRAPLRHIDGFGQILLEDYAGKLDDEGRRHLQRVREASQQMAQLIDDLLNLSRVTRAEIRRETVDLSRMAEIVSESLKKMQSGRKAEFVIEKGLTVEGDERLLRVALDNLLGNAWKYTGKRPQARIEFGWTNHDGRSAYFVRDNGAGFDMAYVHKLFGAFQRLHSVSEFPGTGIGLATVQRIIHRHGGQVWADGTVDKGATFYFTL